MYKLSALQNLLRILFAAVFLFHHRLEQGNASKIHMTLKDHNRIVIDRKNGVFLVELNDKTRLIANLVGGELEYAVADIVK